MLWKVVLESENGIVPIKNYQKILVVINETIKLMAEIDKVVDQP
jgi:hypothetical protein